MQMKGAENAPFLLQPAVKASIWGGRRLKDEYGKRSEVNPLAETWECSTHPDGESLAADGIYKGLPLGEILKLHPEYLGTRCGSGGMLPVLIKLIDAGQDLSVQVHPDDEYAKMNENGQRGKTEMWYVLYADQGAELIYGFNRTLSKTQLRDALNNKTVDRYLQHVPVRKDDVFFVEAGMVHAIGEGMVIAEIQENSNLTYRLYDYERTDKHGCKRELHIEKALDVVNLQSAVHPRQPMRIMKYKNGYALELLCRCRYFQVERLLLNTERHRDMADFKTGGGSFQVLLCTAGCGSLFGKERIIHFFKGDSIFVPANSMPLKLHGRAQLLNVSV